MENNKKINLFILSYSKKNICFNTKNFKNNIKEIINLKKNKIKFEIKIIIYKQNYKLLPKISKFIEKLNPTKIIFEFINSDKIKSNQINELVTYKTLIIPYIEESINYLKDIRSEIIIKNIPYCLITSKAGYIEKNCKKNKFISDECIGCFYKNSCPKIKKNYAKNISQNEIKKITFTNNTNSVVANLRLDLNCNADCLFCTVANDHEKKMTTNQAKNMLFSFKMNGFNRVTITGGEPTLRDDLIEILRCAKLNELKVDLQTNAILLENKNLVKKIKKEKIYQFTIGFPSHIEKKYNYLTKTKAYKKALKGIKNCIELNAGIISFYHVINKENYKDLIKFIEFSQKLSKDIIFAFAFLRPNGNTQKNKEIVPTLTEMKQHIYDMLKKTKNQNPPAMLEGVPLCFMKGYENKSAETYRLLEMAPVNYSSEGKKQHEDIHMFIFKNLKKKSNKCNKCNLNKICAGVWQEYAEIHGLNELTPIKNKKIEDVFQ